MESNRLKVLRKSLNLSQRTFADRLKVTQSTLSQIENGKIMLSADLARKICREFNVNANWLLLGTEPMSATATGGVPGVKKSARIKLIKQGAHAGYLDNLDEPGFLEALDSYIVPGFDRDNCRMFEISGNSMNPLLFEGDIIVGEKEQKLGKIIPGDIYVFVTERGIIVKKVTKSQEKTFTLSSFNETYEDFTVPFEEVRQAWKVRAKITRHFLQNSEIQKSNILSLEQRLSKLESKLKDSKK